MFYLFHGDDNALSRNAYNEFVQKNQEKVFISEVSAEKIANSQAGLFSSTNKIIIFDRLLSEPESKLKQILPLIAKLSSGVNFIDWEDKEISATKIKQLGKDIKIYQSKLPTYIFKFLDSIGTSRQECLKYFVQTKLTHPIELISYLLTRRLHDLVLLGVDDTLLKAAPWQKSQLQKQLKNMGLEKATQTYLQLIELDYQNKSGQLGNSLENEIVNIISSDN